MQIKVVLNETTVECPQLKDYQLPSNAYVSGNPYLRSIVVANVCMGRFDMGGSKIVSLLFQIIQKVAFDSTTHHCYARRLWDILDRHRSFRFISAFLAAPSQLPLGHWFFGSKIWDDAATDGSLLKRLQNVAATKSFHKPYLHNKDEKGQSVMQVAARLDFPHSVEDLLLHEAKFDGLTNIVSSMLSKDSFTAVRQIIQQQYE